MVSSALAFSVMSVLVKLGSRELPVTMLVLARAAVTLVIGAAWLKAKRIAPWGVDKPRLVLRAVFGLGGLACYFSAVSLLPLAEATVLHYLNPIFTAVLAALFLSERADRRLVLAIAVSLVGTVLVARPGSLFGAHVPLSTPGVLAALGGAIFSACAYTTVRRLARTDHPDVIVFYFSLIATPVALPFALATWVRPSPGAWLLMLGVGAATQLGQVLMTRGLALVPAGRATTIGYIQIVFASLWGLGFGERLNGWTLGGAALVVLAVLTLFGGGLARRGPRGHSTRHVERAAEGTDPE